MGRAVSRQLIRPDRRADRIPVYVALRLRSSDTEQVVEHAYCRNIGLGGMRVEAPQALKPGTSVSVALTLPSGRQFACTGHVAWSKQTIHPSLFGSPEASDDDALFGISFDKVAPDRLLPIARLLSARDAERGRAHRLRRLHGWPIHA